MKVLVAQVCLSLCDPMDCIVYRLLCPQDSPGKNTGVGSHSLLPSPGDLPDPGIEPESPTLQADSLMSELPGKPIENILYVLYSISVSSFMRCLHTLKNWAVFSFTFESFYIF